MRWIWQNREISRKLPARPKKLLYVIGYVADRNSHAVRYGLKLMQSQICFICNSFFGLAGSFLLISRFCQTLHAFGITTADGLELLVHIGINTVELGGEGFTPKVKEGDEVKAGQLLCEVDM